MWLGPLLRSCTCLHCHILINAQRSLAHCGHHKLMWPDTTEVLGCFHLQVIYFAVCGREQDKIVVITPLS